MNTNFVDISPSIAPPSQSGVSTTGAESSAMASGKGQARGKAQRFEEQFQEEINRFETAVDKGARTENSPSSRDRVQQRSSTVSDQVSTDEEAAQREFFSKLEALLNRISNGDLKGTLVGAQGLDALKMLLVKAGFDPDEVAGAIAGLKDKSKAEGLNLEDVLGVVSELVVTVDEKASPEVVCMETSALPFIKDLMGKLGLTDAQIDTVVDEADQGTGGISIDVILETLKALEAASREGGNALTFTDSDGSFKQLMSQLNLPGAEESQETFSINDLIKSFEAYKLDKQSKESVASNGGRESEANAALLSGKTGRGETHQLLNSFFSALSLASDSEEASFSYQQIKDQFVNEMMIPEGEKGKQKGLFSPVPGEVKTDQMVKELAALAGENNGTPSGRKMDSSESTGRELRRELTKPEAVFQGSNTANNGNDIESSGTPARAKATPRTLPGYVTQQVGRGIARAVNLGETTLRLQLKPAELGRLTMTIDHQSTGVKVSIVTENQAARDLLASNVNELKSALSSAGISLDSFDVDMNSDFSQSMANAGNQAGQFGRKNGNRQGSGFSAQGNETGDEIPVSADALVTDGSYHFVA